MYKLDPILDKIERLYSPKSIFLFGSRARNDYKKESDYELGILFEQRNFVGENELAQLIEPPDNIRIYPYEFEQFIRGKAIIPFQSSIFLYEITKTGKTLRGKKIVETMSSPPIGIVDLMQDIKFSLARGSDAIVSYSNGDYRTAAILFFKSCFFGTRDLIIFLLREFPCSYNEIYNLSRKINLKTHHRIVECAYWAREKGHLKYCELQDNIFYLNRFVERKLITYYKRWGDKLLIN